MIYKIQDLLGGEMLSQGKMTNVINSGNGIAGSVVLDANDYDLWWPNGLGPQNLYLATVDIVSVISPRVYASVTKRVGFRTIVLNMESVNPDEIQGDCARQSL